ncbi:APC family permease [Candidatus Babeliales bacterium]|nr:APC family permease [Candidatus Babeliales bacterium]
MPKHNNLSLLSVIFVNINIMLGSGIFINTVLLPKLAGFLGFTSYIIVALLILPLILCIAALLEKYPFGGFYTYGKSNLNRFTGFFSSWIYFSTKLASAGLKIHVFSLLMQNAVAWLRPFSTLFLDLVVVGFFTLLNTLNLKISNRVGYFFILTKLTPIMFVFLGGLYLTGHAQFRPDMFLCAGIPATIPYVLYSYIGFEASCSLSQTLKNPERDGPRAVLYSYIVVAVISALYQLLFYSSTGGDALLAQENYMGAIPTFVKTLLPYYQVFARKLISILHIAIAASALGGSYGIFFSNHWNLHTLANHKHIFFSHRLLKFNKHHIPALCVLVEGLIVFGYLLVTNGNQMILQQLGALGPTTAYTLSVLGLAYAHYKGESFSIRRWVPWLGLASCAILLGACLRNLVLYGAGSLYLYLTMALFGTSMYAITSLYRYYKYPVCKVEQK